MTVDINKRRLRLRQNDTSTKKGEEYDSLTENIH